MSLTRVLVEYNWSVACRQVEVLLVSYRLFESRARAVLSYSYCTTLYIYVHSRRPDESMVGDMRDYLIQTVGL